MLLVIDTTLVSDNPSLFRKNFWERILKRIMTFDHKIRDKKVQCTANREAEKKNQVKLINMNILQVRKYYHMTGKKNNRTS